MDIRDKITIFYELNEVLRHVLGEYAKICLYVLLTLYFTGTSSFAIHDIEIIRRSGYQPVI